MFYYILTDEDKPGKCKLGITKDPKQRIRAYKTGSPNCYYEAIYYIDDKIHEKKILDLLKDRFYVQREYVNANPALIKNIIEGYLTDNNLSIEQVRLF